MATSFGHLFSVKSDYKIDQPKSFQKIEEFCVGVMYWQGSEPSAFGFKNG
jgi:hypothetical protein